MNNYWLICLLLFFSANIFAQIKNEDEVKSSTGLILELYQSGENEEEPVTTSAETGDKKKRKKSKKTIEMIVGGSSDEGIAKRTDLPVDD